MSMTSDERTELDRLLAALREEQITQRESARLNELLRSHAAARLRYLDQLYLNAALHWLHGDDLDPADSPTPVRRVEDASDMEPPEPAPSVNPPLITFNPNLVPGFLGRTTAALGSPVLWSIVGVGVLFAGYVVLVSWNMLGKEAADGRLNAVAGSSDSDLQPSASDLPSEAVATITASEATKWQGASATRLTAASTRGFPEPITPGEPLALTAGVVEVKLQQGTTLLVEGPAHWSVMGPNRVSLQSGKVVAIVPEQALGFRVETPNAQIVDLGTEFGVEVSSSGETEVQVYRGKISLRSGANATARRHFKEILLSAGAARRVGATSANEPPLITEVPWRPTYFVPPVAASNEARKISVGGALASSEFGMFGVNNLINQSGLNGNQHTSAMRLPSGQYTMWSSAAGREKDEYVLFDLGANYQLSKVRIWNYNDRHHGARGASLVDLCVASSSIGDPISTPERWNRVVVDQKLNCAPGTDAYATPDEVPLDGVITRFLGIVIKDCCPREEHNPPGFYQCVGLSEVEIYGSKVVPTPHEP